MFIYNSKVAKKKLPIPVRQIQKSIEQNAVILPYVKTTIKPLKNTNPFISMKCNSHKTIEKIQPGRFMMFTIVYGGP